jgi:16S rRNA (guanine(966)-N(2))-methyltransferase RsmD
MGKKVKSHSNPTELRPIGSRALKSCIDTLRPHLFGSRILELFAGQGRVSFAALSEGAISTLLIEKNKILAKELKNHIPKKLGSDKTIEILCQDAWTFLSSPPRAPGFDIIFADPPFPQWDKLDQSHFFSLIGHFCKSGTIFLVKTPSRMLLSSEHPRFSLWKLAHFGESQFAYFLYE